MLFVLQWCVNEFAQCGFESDKSTSALFLTKAFKQITEGGFAIIT